MLGFRLSWHTFSSDTVASCKSHGRTTKAHRPTVSVSLTLCAAHGLSDVSVANQLMRAISNCKLLLSTGKGSLFLNSNLVISSCVQATQLCNNTCPAPHFCSIISIL
jgi:hypothetical protein